MSRVAPFSKILLASGNSNKAREFEELFDSSVKLELSPESIDVEETGKTFTENAFLKAKTYFEKFNKDLQLPCLADDSGLVLDAFPELLGVQSARFSPELPSYTEKCQKILDLYAKKEELKSAEKRRAYFVCVLCFYFSPEKVYFFEGRLLGSISYSLEGNNGFGYDPIFIPDRKELDSKTLAELPEWKRLNSHRAKATQSAREFFKL